MLEQSGTLRRVEGGQTLQTITLTPPEASHYLLPGTWILRAPGATVFRGTTQRSDALEDEDYLLHIGTVESDVRGRHPLYEFYINTYGETDPYHPNNTGFTVWSSDPPAFPIPTLGFENIWEGERWGRDGSNHMLPGLWYSQGDSSYDSYGPCQVPSSCPHYWKAARDNSASGSAPIQKTCEGPEVGATYIVTTPETGSRYSSFGYSLRRGSDDYSSGHVWGSAGLAAPGPPLRNLDIVDTAAPEILRFQGINGAYTNVTGSMVVQLWFDEPVTGISESQFTLFDDEANPLSFPFTVVGQDAHYEIRITDLGAYRGAIIVQLVNDGTVADLSRNPWLEQGGTCSVTIDTTKPTVAFDPIIDPNPSTPASEISWRAVFSEPMNDTALFEWVGNLANSDDLQLVWLSDDIDARIYNINLRTKSGNQLPDGTVAVHGVGTDRAGNELEGAVESASYTIQWANPSGVLGPVSQSWRGPCGSGAGTIAFSIAASESITSSSTARFEPIGTLANHFTVSQVSFPSNGSSGVVRLAATRSRVAQEGTIGVRMLAEALTDVDGNTNLGESESTLAHIVPEEPIITIQLKEGETQRTDRVVFTLESSSPLDGLSRGSFEVFGTLSCLFWIPESVFITESEGVYTVRLSTLSGVDNPRFNWGTIGLRLKGCTTQNVFGNYVPLTESSTYTIGDPPASPTLTPPPPTPTTPTLTATTTATLTPTQVPPTTTVVPPTDAATPFPTGVTPTATAAPSPTVTAEEVLLEFLLGTEAGNPAMDANGDELLDAADLVAGRP